MTIRELEIFVTLAHARSYLKAGSQLGITEAAVSQSMISLQKSLAAELFTHAHRGTRGGGITLTAAGEKFLPAAEAVLAAVEHAKQSVHKVVKETFCTNP